MSRGVANRHKYRCHVCLTVTGRRIAKAALPPRLRFDATIYAKIKLSVRQYAATQEPPMRDWLFLLAPPALIFYFIAYPDKFYEFVFWAKRLIG
jgi:hypothetical protein